MQNRFTFSNIPIELIRSVAIIAEVGSFTKAADRLGLSQPAISAQMKRFQLVAGGEVFDRVPGGVTLNERGRLILPHALRLLRANDQILSIGGARTTGRQIRLGISPTFATLFLARYNAAAHGEVTLLCESSERLEAELARGQIDIACFFKPSPEFSRIVEKWDEPFSWARSPSFVLSPGAPVPLVGWPGYMSERLAITTLESAGLSYKFAVATPDASSAFAALEGGLGVMPVPTRFIVAPLVAAQEYYLPALPHVAAGICLHSHVRSSDFEALLSLLKTLEPTKAGSVDPIPTDDAVRANRG